MNSGTVTVYIVCYIVRYIMCYSVIYTYIHLDGSLQSNLSPIVLPQVVATRRICNAEVHTPPACNDGSLHSGRYSVLSLIVGQCSYGVGYDAFVEILQGSLVPTVIVCNHTLHSV